MGGAFADRWGVPVQGADEEGIAALDGAVECLLALAGDPAAEAEAAVDIDDDLMLGRVYRAYLSLYATKAAGVAEATKLLTELDGAEERASEREALHLRTARSSAAGDWRGAARALERALVLYPGDLPALKVARTSTSSSAPGLPRLPAGTGPGQGEELVRSSVATATTCLPQPAWPRE